MWHRNFLKELQSSFSLWDAELVLGLKYKLPDATEWSGRKTAFNSQYTVWMEGVVATSIKNIFHTT